MAADREPAAVRTIDGGPVLLADKVAFLARPDSYPEPTAQVDAIETHMSWVFLTDRYAYKLKKPVLLEYLDYTTLEARERFCAEEVRLNRKLAPDVYLRVVPLALASSRGQLVVEEPGEAVDWLVKMRRLPLAARLDVLIGRRAVDRRRLVQALRRLTLFYAGAERAGFDPDAYRAQLHRAIDRNRGSLAVPAHGLPADATARVLARQAEFVTRTDSPLAARAECVVDAHGDLRPEHVYLLDPPVVLDRLEFDRDLRLLDPADELAFLSLECDRLGAPWLASAAFDVYTRETGDRPPPAVVAFYRSLRACMRARLAIGHVDRPDGPAAVRWQAAAARYLELADEASLAFS